MKKGEINLIDIIKIGLLITLIVVFYKAIKFGYLYEKIW